MLKLNKNEVVPTSCERCNGELILCPANFPWNEEFWICEDCGFTY